ncbi:MAG: hypothetical protein Ta2A_11780 [Treponemataceae bacterium]|nr:MAG: hypothetical protein Ta2A_11780 [Treponemataceae bacterium]
MRSLSVANMIVFLVFSVVTCATTSAGKAPLWVTDRTVAFPTSEWLCVVESAGDRARADAAALNALAQVFRVDIAAATATYQSYARTVTESATQNSARFAQEVNATSNVAGLVGIQKDFWTSPDGTVYVAARMNRRECSARYEALIRENETMIQHLTADATRRPTTFEAYASLSTAATIAAATDNFQRILEVLDVSTTSRKSAYGSAAAVKLLAQNAAREITINITVRGDEGGRITAALSQFCTTRGFRTAAGGNNPYTLTGDYSAEERTGGEYRYVYYALQIRMRDKSGMELFAFSYADHEGHPAMNGAHDRALRAVESAIRSGMFAQNFEIYLGSLLR